MIVLWDCVQLICYESPLFAKESDESKSDIFPYLNFTHCTRSFKISSLYIGVGYSKRSSFNKAHGGEGAVKSTLFVQTEQFTYHKSKKKISGWEGVQLNLFRRFHRSINLFNFTLINGTVRRRRTMRYLFIEKYGGGGGEVSITWIVSKVKVLISTYSQFWKKTWRVGRGVGYFLSPFLNQPLATTAEPNIALNLCRSYRKLTPVF